MERCLSKQLKNEIEKIREPEENKKVEQQYPIEEKDEELEKFKFYLVTITISLLIILCVVGIILLLG